jgi:hypothetical protein
VVLQLTRFKASEFGPEIKKKMKEMGPFSDVEVNQTNDSLILRDSVGNLKRIREMIESLEKWEREKGRNK